MILDVTIGTQRRARAEVTMAFYGVMIANEAEFPKEVVGSNLRKGVDDRMIGDEAVFSERRVAHGIGADVAG